MGYLQRARGLFRSACGIAAAVTVVTAHAIDAPVPLAAYNVDPSQVSVSGIDSGGGMAIQLGVAYSSRIMGVAAFAAAPYDCMRAGNISRNLCARTETPDIGPLAANMRAWSGTKIDPVANLERQRVYLYSGIRDQTVSVTVVGQSARLYADFVAQRNLRFEDTIEAGHTFPTDFDSPRRPPCTSEVSVANCNFDGAYESLHWIYGELVPRTMQPGGKLIAIDQSEFISRDLGMDDTAFVYLPTRCAAGARCRLHVFLHACGQSYDILGDPFYAFFSGHTLWAETNDIVLLFPQTYPDDVLNPKGCWDTEGRYDSQFDQKGGWQIEAIMKMVSRITSGYAGVRAIEYQHAEWNHYFVTTGSDEIAKLDAGGFEGWSRTGESFGVFPLDTPGTRNTCRFFSTAFAPRSSHFYATTGDECEIVKRNTDWSFEDEVFAVAPPDGAGVCAPGLQPLFRLYNNGEGGAPNHRYTKSLATRDAMIVSGWIAEGEGALGVTACVAE